jgi:hypothetical protein
MKYKKLGYHRYCSNVCAQRHTRTKQHIVVDDAIVLDSTWEALFWGLCGLLKVPVERFDREHGVAWGNDKWYAPDFWLPSIQAAVEIKGIEDDDDPEKWNVYRHEHGSLTVVDVDSLGRLRALSRAELLSSLT